MNEQKKRGKEDLLKKQKEIEEQEKLAILAKADEVKDLTLDFNTEGDFELKSEIEALMLDPIDNPEEKHDLYYNIINKLLKQYLPKGDEHRVARNYIYEEKNTFLTGKRIDKSGIRGADGRMSYRPNMHELINIITGWIASNGSMIDLYIKLRDKNIEMGYGKPKLEK